MKKLMDNIAELVKVKTIITVAVMTIFTGMALTGKLEGDQVMLIITTVISFYFGTQHEKK